MQINMTEKSKIFFKFNRGEAGYSLMDFGVGGTSFEYNIEKHSICGPLVEYLDPYHKLREGITYFRGNGENSIISRVTKINLPLVIPVLRWELEQKKIEASVTYTEAQALIINFKDKADYALFMFRFNDIFGVREK
jgi:hypothetical protein